MRIGCTPFLNARPLVWGLSSGHLLIPIAPSRMARALRKGRVDVGLVPVVELFRSKRLRLIPAAAIGSRGAVRSVRLLSRTPPGTARLMYADSNSGTSVLLARLLLKRLFGVQRLAVKRVDTRRFRPVRLRCGEVLLQIGDVALRPPPKDVKVHDLGILWHRMTHLPVVFAVWAAVKGSSPHGVKAILRKSAREGVRNAAAVARAYAPPNGPGLPACVHYLRKNLSFRVGPVEMRSIRLFRRLLRSEGWI
jgi:chorismate dehydratase